MGEGTTLRTKLLFQAQLQSAQVSRVNPWQLAISTLKRLPPTWEQDSPNLKKNKPIFQLLTYFFFFPM